MWWMQWKAWVCFYVLGLLSGVYSHTVYLGYLENKADKAHNEWYNKNSSDVEKEKLKIRTNERKVVYVQKHLGNDCFVTPERLLVVNAAITNDTRELNK